MRKTAILMLFALSCAVTAFGQSANFTATTVSGCSPLVVNFQDQSLGNITSWFWEFGNGNTSTLRNPSATYFTPGTYTVKLTVSNSQTSHTLTRTNYITVYGKPSINFIVNDSTSCYPHPAQFTDLSQPSTGTVNSSWLWDFGDGSQSDEQNPLHVYTQSGNYTITLKVTNDKGCYSVFTKQAYIRINGGVEADFTSTLPTVCKPPFNINFTNNSTGPGTLTYLWDFGDGNTSTLQNPMHTYVTAGNYTVILSTTSSQGCTDTAIRENLIQIHDINTQFAAPDSICIDADVNFINNSTPAPLSSSWTFGNGETSDLINPTLSYPAIGTYTVSLYNTYQYCTDSFTKTIKVLPRPVAAFGSDVRFRCQPPHTVSFQDQSTNAVGWLWDFGDGITSTSQNPTHIYTSFGNFDVQLIVTNSSGCTDTVKINDYIRVRRPIITFLDLPVKGCIPYTIRMRASVSTLDNVTSYLWDFGDGNTSTQASPNHTYTDQGTYTVTLTVTTSTGCTESFTMPDAVQVGRRPIINFSAEPTTACAFQTIQFTDLTNEADLWLWDFGDGGTSPVQHPSYQYSDTGKFDVMLYATNNGCMDSLLKPQYVTIRPPIAKYGYETNCINRLQFNFRDSSIGANSWFWDFGDGTTSTEQHPVHYFPAYDTYNVSLTVTNDTCSHTITQPIKVIRENPDFTANVTEACKKASIHFTATNTNSNVVTYFWNFGNGNTRNTTAVSTNNTYTVSGYYTVTLVTTDIYGCKDTTIKNNYIRINGPIANFTATNTSGCKGLTTTFNDLSTDDGISPVVGWRWDFGDGHIQSFTAAPFQHTYNDTGSYDVKLVVTDAGGCMDSVTITDVVKTTSPRADFHALDTLSCPGGNVRFRNDTDPLGYTSAWYFGDDSSSILRNPTHQYNDTGRYTVKLVITDPFGCSDSLTRPDYIRIDKPVASFTVNDSISSCTPFEVQFTNTSHFYISSQWDLGAGNSTRANPITFYNTPGTYNVRLIVRSRGNCYDTTYKNIVVFDTAGSRITYDPLQGCKPLDVQFSAYSPGPMDEYTWDFGDGVLETRTDTFTTHEYNFFGNFVPKVILTDPAGCIIPITGIDTIKIRGATVNFGLDNSFYCDSGFVNFIDSTSFNDSVTAYHWEFGDGNTSDLQNPGHFYSSPGLYTVTLNVQTISACVDTFSIVNAVKIVESPLIRIGGDSVICINDFIEHLGEFQRSDTSVIRWNWSFPNGNTSGVQYPIAQQYNTAGNFTVSTIAVNSSGCSDTATKNIRVNPLPQVTMPVTMNMQAGFPITIPATYSSNVMNYLWTPSESLNCRECPQPIASPKFNTLYNVAFVDSNGCKNTGDIQILVYCENGNVFIPNTFSPNGDGSNDVFYVRGKGLERVKSLRIFNRWGEIVFEKQQFPVNDASYGWDGKYKGNKPVPDVYVYQVEVFCDNSQVIRFEGNVALIQ